MFLPLGVDRKKIQATIDSYKEVAEEIRQINPDTIVVVTPHSIMYADYFHISPGEHAKGDFAQFGAPQEEIGTLAEWLACIDRDMPLHLTRFFPRRNMKEKEPTNVDLLYELQKEAKKYLNRVFVGNV